MTKRQWFLYQSCFRKISNFWLKAYLEVEAGEKGFKEVYVMRCLTFAQDHLDQASNSYEESESSWVRPVPPHVCDARVAVR